MSEAVELIKERIAKVDKDRETALMAKVRAEREVDNQQTLLGIYDASLKSLREDLAKLAPTEES